MTCDRRLVSYFRDGELPPDQRSDIDAHISECSDCAQTHRAYVQLAQALRSMPMLQAPPSLEAGVRARIAEYEASRPRGGWLGGLGRAVAPAAIAASLLIAMLVAFRPGAVDLPIRAPAAQAPPAVVVSAPPPIAPNQAEPPGNPRVSLAPERMANVPSPIRRLYVSSPQLQQQLGLPAQGSKTIILREQAFQGGVALWRSDTREIYVLNRAGGAWTRYSDAWKPGDPVAMLATPPLGARVPDAGFAAVLRTHPEVQARLGWAVYEPRGSGGAVQEFERGIVVWSPHGLLYVLSNNGTWKTYPDASIR